MAAYQSVVFTTEFMLSLTKLSRADQRRILRALELLDTNERHPSLNVHQLSGQQAGLWTAYATKSLRITYRRLDEGYKEVVEASHHYGD